MGGLLKHAVRSARQPMHGGGEDAAAEGATTLAENGSGSDGEGRAKRVLTPEQDAARRARREQLAEERAAKLAKIASGESGLGKVRQHVNPLSPVFREPIPTPAWPEVYDDVSRPLHIDMGCGKGRMLLEMAKLEPNRNFLGVEIREALVVRADRWVREQGIRNLHYVSGNINVSLESLLASYPGTLDLVSVLMPDPWFKKRHKKRRLLQPELVEQVAALMKPGARFFVMSDVQV
jgi:tRNA (guanine-N7-)-methyltransferase